MGNRNVGKGFAILIALIIYGGTAMDLYTGNISGRFVRINRWKQPNRYWVSIIIQIVLATAILYANFLG